MENRFKVLVIGEVLFDIFAQKNVEILGGAPFNFAFHLAKLGIDVKFISRIGDDKRGQIIRNFCDKYGLKIDYLQQTKDFPTGEVKVKLDDKGSPTFNIVKNVAWDNIVFNEELEELIKKQSFDLVYFGTLAQRNKTSRKTIRMVLEETKDALKFLDINLRAPYYKREVLDYSLANCLVLKLNTDELNLCRKYYNLSKKTELALADLAQRFSIKIINLTRGAKGSILLNNQQCYQQKSVPLKKIVDAVGAGDAYAAILALGVLKGWHLQKILERATYFAQLICQNQGAIPQDMEIYNNILKW
jgi:fructokinase